MIKVHGAVIRSELIRRGLTYHDLARKTGMNARVVANLICENEHTPSLQSRLESALGFAVWDSLSHFEKRKHMAKFFGVDPCTLLHPELKTLARKRGVEITKGHASRRQILASLEADFDTATAAVADILATENGNTQPKGAR
ncbi:MAG: hypothetical protein PCFJNLEI_00317 [Verrucomicrobiae bacterium]|nr:hypothetical protein [Verrucomicrobiae bacterium]